MGDRKSKSQFASRRRRSSRLLGLSAPESGSNFRGLRRSFRLRELAKSAMIMSQSTQMASCKPGLHPKRGKGRNPKPKPKRLSFLYDPDASIYFRGGALEIAKFMRCMRKVDANKFRRAYAYDRETSDLWDKITEKRFIVVSGQEHPFPEVGRSHGIMWVGVHGIDSTCAVFLNEEPHMQRILDKLGDSFLRTLLTYVLSEMEDIADSPPYSDAIDGKPFAVVSLPDVSRVDKENRHEAPAATIKAQGEATKYLEGKIHHDSAFTRHEAEQIAISAFQHLCTKKFKAEEIVVCTFHENDGDEFPSALTTSEIDSHLANIELESD